MMSSDARSEFEVVVLCAGILLMLLFLIPICKFDYLDITTADGKTKCVYFKREKQMDEAIEALKAVCYTERVS